MLYKLEQAGLDNISPGDPVSSDVLVATLSLVCLVILLLVVKYREYIRFYSIWPIFTIYFTLTAESKTHKQFSLFLLVCFSISFTVLLKLLVKGTVWSMSPSPTYIIYTRAACSDCKVSLVRHFPEYVIVLGYFILVSYRVVFPFLSLGFL